MPLSRFAAFAGAALIASAAPTASANLVVNGDFAGLSLAGWFFSGTVQAQQDSAYQACCGATGSSPNGTFASFGPGSPARDGSLTQTFSTVVGQAYRLTFDFGSFGGPSDLEVFYGNSGVAQVSAPGGTDLSSLFASYTFDFVATQSVAMVAFTDVSPAGSGGSIDAFLTSVRVEAVPEPASLALLGLGLAGLGIRRRSTAA